MPRLTRNDYLTIRKFLSKLWKENNGRLFSALPGYAQHELHDFFAPTSYMTDAEANTHRKAISKAFPSLPQSAGRAFQALRASLEGQRNQIIDRQQARTRHSYKVAGKTRSIRISSVSRPNIDIEILAQALVGIAKEDVDGSLLAKARKVATRVDRKRP